MCHDIYDLAPNAAFPAYFEVSDLFNPKWKIPGAPPMPVQKMGRCECYGTTTNALKEHTATIFGPHCEQDTYRDIRCSGHGTPICTILNIGGYNPDKVVNSLNGGGKIGYLCNEAGFSNRGSQVCQCELGWGPDEGGGKSCNIRTPCPNSPVAVFAGGNCECTVDYYRDGKGSLAVCLPNCAATKGSGHGECIYNSHFNYRIPWCRF